jgi:hypothetical protein
MIYQIRDWRSHFENNKSREREQCSFVCVPNKQHGMGLIRVLAEPDGAAIIGVWVLILQACSRQGRHRDGWLTDDGHPAGNPWTVADLALRWRRPEAEIERTLFCLSSPQVGWIQAHPEVPAECPPSALEENRRELKRTEGAPIGGAASPAPHPPALLDREDRAQEVEREAQEMSASEMLQIIWQKGVKLLRDAGMENRAARDLLGAHAKNYGQQALVAAVLMTEKATPADPKGYLTKLLQKPKGERPSGGETRQQRNLSTINRKIAERNKQANG